MGAPAAIAARMSAKLCARAHDGDLRQRDQGHACRRPGPGEVRARRSALCLDPAHDALRRGGQLLLPARVPDGVWYVTSSVKWQGASQMEGGSMMQRVDVRGGRLVKVVLR
jgi:hypothetical protein